MAEIVEIEFTKLNFRAVTAESSKPSRRVPFTGRFISPFPIRVYDYVSMKSPYSYTYIVHSYLFLKPVRPGRGSINPFSRSVSFMFRPMLRGHDGACLSTSGGRGSPWPASGVGPSREHEKEHEPRLTPIHRPIHPPRFRFACTSRCTITCG
jgi:hypothetical protein